MNWEHLRREALLVDYVSNWFNPLHTFRSVSGTAQPTHHADTIYELAILEKYYHPGIRLLCLGSKPRARAMRSFLCPGFLGAVLRMLGGFI